jgi:hypothetical protein
VASVFGCSGGAPVAQHGQEIKEGEVGARALLKKEKDGEKRWTTDGAVPVLTQRGGGRGGGVLARVSMQRVEYGPPCALSTLESAVRTAAA